MVNTRVNINDVDHETVGGVLYEILCKKKWFPLISKLIKFRQDIKGIRDELEKIVQNSIRILKERIVVELERDLFQFKHHCLIRH